MRKNLRQRKWVGLGGGLIIAAAALVYCHWALTKPLPNLQPSVISLPKVQALSGQLNWPKSGQAAVGLVGTDILETAGKQTPTPTASTAKLITALTVLKAKPITAGQPGPTITLTANDANLYATYLAHDGSVVKVVAGEQISEYQMFQTMLLPSANNMADSLAIWAYGSLANYAKAANEYLASLGLQNTHVGKDASGLDPSTTSTAADLAKIGDLAMQNPVLAGIVAQPTAGNIPVVGNIKNVNFLLGNSGIVGIKTGNSDQAGGVFVSAAKVAVDGQVQTIVTAYAAAPDLFTAVQGSLPMIQSAEANFKPVSAITKGSVVGNYNLPWGGQVSAVATSDLNNKIWAGTSISAKAKLQAIPAASKSGQDVGSVSANNKSVGVVLDKNVPTPSTWWRLTHPFN